MAEPGDSVPDQIRAIDKGLIDAHRLRKYLMAGVGKEAGSSRLNSSHLRTLMYLSREGAACMNVLSDHVGLEAGSFTPVADRLIDEDMVSRQPDPADRRRIQLRLTAKGKDKVEGIQEIILRTIADKLADLDRDSLVKLVTGLAAVTEVFEILWEGR